MKELSLHILDIARNSINAGASRIEVTIWEEQDKNWIIMKVQDNGKGMSNKMQEKINDPFFTTGNKKTGLGIPLLIQHAEATGGEVKIQSQQGKGTTVIASFSYDHIDRQPMGDISSTIVGLIRSNPEIEWIYTQWRNRKNFKLDTREIKKELDGLEISNALVIQFLKDMIEENLEALSE